MGFSITDMLNKDTSMAAAPVKDHTIERISYSKLVPSEDNFYSMQEIEELKTAIELAGRVLNNLVVTPLEDGKYKILSGHRRHRAVGMLLDEGKTEYEFLPCSVEQIDDTDRAVREQVLLIADHLFAETIRRIDLDECVLHTIWIRETDNRFSFSILFCYH